ncbi:hypothetical protein V8F20_008808 [Naviculisporaceae sp. PSN 640]
MACITSSDPKDTTTFSHDEEALHAPPSYDGSAPLLGDDGSGSEHLTTGNSMPMEDNDTKPAAMTRVLGPLSFFTFMFLFFAPLAFLVIMAHREADLLGFSFLAYLLLCDMLLAPVILAIVVAAGAASMNYLKPREGERDEKDRANDPAITVVMCGVLWVLLYFLFYGTIWSWASSKPVAELLEEGGLIFKFESKFEQANILTELTTCLERSVPSGEAEISDVVLCLKVMGMKGP